MRKSETSLSRRALVAGLAMPVTISTASAQNAKRPNFGSGSLAVDSATATANQNTRKIAATLVIVNNGQTALRLFNSAQISASDNAGNTWTELPRGTYITGIYVCETGNSCLTRDRQLTEQLATLLEPGDAMTVILTMASSGRSSQQGDLANVGFSPMVQNVKEVVGVDGRVFEGGAWASRSLGAANIPLRWVS